MGMTSEVIFRDNGDMVIIYNNEVEFAREVFKKENGVWINIDSVRKKH